MITAKVICDSISPQGKRLTTFENRNPKFIHGEFMTHRVFSRNASSSRAIPTERLLAEVKSDLARASPVFWGKNQKGMQAAEELEDNYLGPRQQVQFAWRSAAMGAANCAEEMLKWGAHKQIVNRVLEPFTHINVVCTATEYMNFFGLRLDKAAQPEARVLAEAMWRAYNESEPLKLQPGEWHTPYFDREDWQPTISTAMAIKISVARCARVSYRSFETGNRSTIEEDLKLYDRLLGAQPLHASPAEHQATPDLYRSDFSHDPRNSVREYCNWANPDEHGNFVGWRQYRKMLPGEAVAPLPDEYRHSPDV